MKAIQFKGTNYQNIIDEIKSHFVVSTVNKIEDGIGNITELKIYTDTDVVIEIVKTDYLVFDDNDYSVWTEKSFRNKYKDDRYKFLRRGLSDEYYFINAISEVSNIDERTLSNDNLRYQNANYFPDEQTAEKFNKIQTLQRKLLRFSLEHGGDKIDWSADNTMKWFIEYDHDSLKIETRYARYKQSPNKIYFVSEEICLKAIDNFRNEILEVMRIEW